MSVEKLFPPPRTLVKRHILCALQRYWPKNRTAIDTLPVRQSSSQNDIKIPLRLQSIQLPTWARSWGVDGVILVPEELIPADRKTADPSLWRDIDWFYAAFLLLEGWHERLWEAKKGPIHSYSYRLKGWDERVWQHAWVNRIGLFLREWAAHLEKVSPESLFGSLPQVEIQMTHDVDAVKKTIAIRLKQGVFTGMNAIRALLHGYLTEALQLSQKSLKLLFGQNNWWKFEELLAAEKSANIRSIFHFYADNRHKTFNRWLFDPGYKIKTLKNKRLIKQLIDIGHEIGLHPSFESWQDRESLFAQKSALEAVSGSPVIACRQHWLRFSWEKTWNSQEYAEISRDYTLMFNDRPGFRNGSALSWNPWNTDTQKAHMIESLPSVMMDSHFYDYQCLNDVQRRQQMQYWLEECRAVYGQVAVLWHPHTLSSDYNWGQGFKELLQNIKEMNTQ